MKITTKMSKEELTNYLASQAKAVKGKSKEVFDMMVNTDNAMKKDAKAVKKADLLSLAREVLKVTGVEPVPTAEASLKKSVKTSSKKSEKTEKVEPKKSEEKTEKVEPKKKTEKKEKVVKKAEESVDLAEMFKDEIVLDNVKYEIAHDIVKMADLRKAVEDEDSQVLFAFYWTERHLAQFPYQNDKLTHPDKFKDDIDLAYCIYTSDADKVAYAVSLECEGVYPIYPNELKEVNGLRFCNGIEYQIYREKSDK